MKITIIGHFKTGDLFSEEANNQKEFYYCLDKIFNNASCIYPPDKVIVDRKIPKYIQEWADDSEFDILTEIRNSTNEDIDFGDIESHRSEFEDDWIDEDIDDECFDSDYADDDYFFGREEQNEEDESDENDPINQA